jgi:DNA transformation protein
MPKKRTTRRDGDPIEGQTNSGPTIAKRLREVGVRTMADLERVGPAGTYLRSCEAHPGKTIPVCYYLYSLEGALRGQHWDAIGDRVKQSLLHEVGRK